MALHGLTSSEVAILQRALDKINNQRNNQVTRLLSGDKFTQEEDHQSPEFYIAKSDTAIDALDTVSDPPVLSSELCDLFKILPDGASWKLVSAEGTAQKRVFNVSSEAVDADTYFLIQRDSFGKWIAVQGGGGSTNIFEFVIDSVDCTEESAEVTAVTAPCGGSLPTGSPLKVYDDLGCMLAFPEVQLIGAKGYAVKMDGPGRGDPSTTDCHWAILTLCGSVEC